MNIDKKAENEQIAQAIIEHINSAYSMYKKGELGSEPTLTATYLLDYILQHRVCPFYKGLDLRKEQQNRIRGILTTLVNSGKISSSIGVGENGQEARCYEPVGEK